MGVEVLKSIFGSITSGIHISSDVAYWLAVIGIGLIAVVCGAYLVYGLVKLGKMIADIKIKHFALLMLATGAVLLGIAAILP